MSKAAVDRMCAELRQLAAEHGEKTVLEGFNWAMREYCLYLIDHDPERYAQIIALAKEHGVPLVPIVRRATLH
jgi:hypothetical protein